MSCIRGHRTTSCGIPVCRNKVFWTVKRPGRPSNSCTCRYGGAGGCKCVVAASKLTCPHKAKKGEKRSGECRCDEQGRYCCLLEAEHWTALLSLQKPSVEFFPTREALEARDFAATPSSLSPTPAYTAPSPQIYGSMPNTPTPVSGALQVHGLPAQYNGASPLRSPLGMRFQMMGIGGPQGSVSIIPDPLAWEGQAPPAPHPYHPGQYQQTQQPLPEERSCCQDPSSPQSRAPFSQYISPSHMGDPSQQLSFAPFEDILQDVSLPAEQPLVPAPFDYDKMTSDYFSYQLPNAICQSCGLSGCTCKSCPPVLQNFSNGSWAQCCGRKHARSIAPATTQQPVQDSAYPHQLAPIDEPPFPAPQFQDVPQFADPALGLHSPAATSDFAAFELDPDLSMSDGPPQIDPSDFLMSDLDRLMNDSPSGEGDGGGCCCGP